MEITDTQRPTCCNLHSSRPFDEGPCDEAHLTQRPDPRMYAAPAAERPPVREWLAAINYGASPTEGWD